MENHHFFIGKPSINGPFSMAMLNNQMVIYNRYIHGIMMQPGPAPPSHNVFGVSVIPTSRLAVVYRKLCEAMFYLLVLTGASRECMGMGEWDDY